MTLTTPAAVGLCARYFFILCNARSLPSLCSLSAACAFSCFALHFSTNDRSTRTFLKANAMSASRSCIARNDAPKHCIISGALSTRVSSFLFIINIDITTRNHTLNPSLNIASRTLADVSAGKLSVKKHSSHLDAIITSSTSHASRCFPTFGSIFATTSCRTPYSTIVPRMSAAWMSGGEMSSRSAHRTQNASSSSVTTSRRNAATKFMPWQYPVDGLCFA
mmetsp:Transcript_839/g.2719  ORF Transcript_839/g.2719 Transcript_839/m.2719 type:complete len:221 (-) Transcript_839:797-1459(-)